MGIVEKLRLVDCTFWYKPFGHGIDTDLDVPAYELGALSHEAANEIERLRVDLEEYRRDVERLREALESFSCECETEDDCCAVTGSFCGWEARAALKEGE